MSYRKFTSTLFPSVVLLAAQLQASVSGLDLADGETSKSNFALDVTSDLSWYQAADEIKNQLIQNNKNLGYLGSKVDIHSSTLQILWKSPVPDAISKMNRTRVDGVNISIVETNYSEDDIVRASELVLDAAQKRMIPQVSYVTGSDDGNSLLVAFAVDEFSTHSSVKLQNEISALTSMNVEVKEAQGPQPAGRQNDSAPWFGGGMMEHPNFNPPGDLDPYKFCSTGFSVLLPNGYGRLLSARHCDTYGNLAWKNGQHDALTDGGDDVDISETDDSMLIDPVGGTAGWVHGGPWNASSSHPRYHLKVANAISPSADAFMCTSGANSGEHCGLQVINSIIASWTCEFGGTCHGWLATESSTTLATVGGDSGGPAYSNRTDGRVTARGIIYGGSSRTDCSQVRFSVSNCYSTVYIVGIERLLNLWDVTIETTA